MTDLAEASNSDPRDVRMRGFARRSTVEEAWRWLDLHAKQLVGESVPLLECAGRVLACPVFSSYDVPAFDRSMMDGFAVIAADTLGAAPYQRLCLRLIGSAWPGRPFAGSLTRGTAVQIMTGAPIPVGADAVLPAENAQIESHRVFALDEVSPGKHVGSAGEDIAASSLVLPAGRRLRPQDIGVISSIGISEIEVVRRPQVRLVITGNELLPTGSAPTPHHIVDANGPMLKSLVERDGGVVINPGIVADERDQIVHAMRDDADLILISGGSSVGQEDLAPMLLAEHGELAIHGIAMRPSSPAGLGRLGARLVFLLPGNPVSCLCGYDFFAGRAIRILGGRSFDWPYRRVRMPLKRKLVSVVGRVDYARVKITEHQVEPLAISGASILSSTTRADGFVVIPADNEGYPAGAEVDVYLYDPNS